MNTFHDSGHAEIMSRPTQRQSSDYYEQLKEKYIQILQKKELKFEVDKTDRRRTIVCVEANKFTVFQLEQLIEINRQTEELLNSTNNRPGKG